MAVAPLLNALVKIHKQFAHTALSGMIVIEVKQCFLERRPLLRRLSDVAGKKVSGNRIAAQRHELCKRIEQRWLSPATFDRYAVWCSFWIVREDARILVAEQELKLAELRALESAGICQEASEGEK